jgi:hypothetical protein
MGKWYSDNIRSLTEGQSFIDVRVCSPIYWMHPLQNPTLGVLVEEGATCPRTTNRALVHRSQGVRHRAEGCMALRWWQQCHKRYLRGTGQHRVVCMSSTRMGLCTCWLLNSPVLVGRIWATRILQRNRNILTYPSWVCNFSSIQISSHR